MTVNTESVANLLKGFVELAIWDGELFESLLKEAGPNDPILHNVSTNKET